MVPEPLIGNPAVYHMPYSVRFEGSLDVPSLERALQELVRRHEALRTVFSQTDDGALQAVLPFAPAPLAVTDLSALPPEERAAAFGREAEAEARRPFDLERGPVMRCELVRLEAGRHVLLLSLHHIVSDGWSMDVLARELVALYEGKPLPELPIQYADFAVGTGSGWPAASWSGRPPGGKRRSTACRRSWRCRSTGRARRRRVTAVPASGWSCRATPTARCAT